MCYWLQYLNGIILNEKKSLWKGVKLIIMVVNKSNSDGKYWQMVSISARDSKDLVLGLMTLDYRQFLVWHTILGKPKKQIVGQTKPQVEWKYWQSA